jgi:putative hydrolase of the HAD superfamily
VTLFPEAPDETGTKMPVRSDASTSTRRPAGRFDAVLFDLFHTLTDVNDSPGIPSWRILGVDPITWNRTILDDSRHHALGEEPDPFLSLRRIVHSIDPSIPEERIHEAVANRRARFRHALVNIRPAVVESLSSLRVSGFRLGLVSNAAYDEVEAWPDSPLAPLFDAALFSCHEKVMKPDPEIYLWCAERLRVAPGRCLFVGDGGSREHAGARAVGMATVLMLGFLEESLPAVAAARPRDADGVVRSLAELETLIDRL